MRSDDAELAIMLVVLSVIVISVFMNYTPVNY